MHGYISPSLNSSDDPFFDSSIVHCQSVDDEIWSGYTIHGRRAIRETFEGWCLETLLAKS